MDMAPTIKSQLEDRKNAAIKESILSFVRDNSQLTINEIMTALAVEDGDASCTPEFEADVVLGTPLCEMIGASNGVAAAPAPTNGHTPRKKAPKNGKAVKAKKAPQPKKAKAANGAPKKKAKAANGAPKRANGTAAAQVTVEAFLSSKKKGDTFKTKDFSEAGKIGQQTALNRLAKSDRLKTQGIRRAMVWVVQ